jgi:hypothetical protein
MSTATSPHRALAGLDSGRAEPSDESTSLHHSRGRVAERLNAAVLKTARRVNLVSGVRIPPLPLSPDLRPLFELAPLGGRYACEMRARVKPAHPALEPMRLAIKALATGSGQVRTRLQAAEPHFGVVFESEMRTPAEKHLRLRIGAGLVEGGDEDDASDAEVADSIALLDEARAVKIAGDMLRLYELLAGLRTDDGYGLFD